MRSASLQPPQQLSAAPSGSPALAGRLSLLSPAQAVYLKNGELSKWLFFVATGVGVIRCATPWTRWVVPSCTRTASHSSKDS